MPNINKSLEATCLFCAKPFRRKPSHHPGGRLQQTCSGACRQALARVRTKTVLNCTQCGTEFRRSPSSVRTGQQNTFCSHSCKGKWMSQNLLGDRHPNWKGGNIEYLTSLIHANQRVKDWAVTVLANANGACERCGDPAAEAHHKREVEELLALILDPANGEALCKGCHVAHHHSS